jgi:hypothetical protein
MPSGRLLRGRGLRGPVATAQTPDFAVYLLTGLRPSDDTLPEPRHMLDRLTPSASLPTAPP